MTALIKQMLEANLKKEMEERLANPSLLDCQLVYNQLVDDLLNGKTVSIEMKDSLVQIRSTIHVLGGYVYGK